MLIFDMGKTNKKAFVFDDSYNIVYEDSHRIDELKDEDGFLCDDLETLTRWVLPRFEKLIESKEFRYQCGEFFIFRCKLCSYK